VSRAEIEQTRGVDSHSVLKTLMARGIVKVSGRGKGPGRPLLFATTKAFLEQFGLRDLRDLPSEDEVEQLVEKSLAQTEDATYLRGPEVR
jgi:segregation and condensation protein B